MQNRRQMCCWKEEKSLKLNLKMTERGNNYDDGDYAHRDVPQTHQGVRWQNALGINMLLRCNKTSPRASTLHANFIRGAMRETRLSMQMRELSISKLQLVPAKCMITDVGFCAVTIIQMCKAFSSWILQWHCTQLYQYSQFWVWEVSTYSLRGGGGLVGRFFGIEVKCTMVHDWKNQLS